MDLESDKLERMQWCDKNLTKIHARLHELLKEHLVEAKETHKHLLDQYMRERKTGKIPAKDSLLAQKIRGGDHLIKVMESRLKGKPREIDHWVDLVSMKELFARTIKKPQASLLLSVAYNLYE